MEQIDVRILDKDYRLIVAAEDKPRLIEAAALVDEKMRSVRDDSRVTQLDRIAVGAALQQVFSARSLQVLFFKRALVSVLNQAPARFSRDAATACSP